MSRRRKVAIAAAAIIVLTASVFIVRQLRRPSTGVAAASHIIDNAGKFDSNEHAAQAMYDASRHLLDAALTCRDKDKRPETRCRPLFEAAAIGQVTTSSLMRCRQPTVFNTRQTWIRYLAALRKFERRAGGQAAPTIPSPPAC